MSIKRTTGVFLLVLIVITSYMPGSLSAQDKGSASARIEIPGLHRTVQVTTDKWGVPHVFAQNDHDAYMAMGYLQARDRFFQLDVYRRQASATLAELLGPGVGDVTLMGDIMFRTNGLRRAAERSMKAYSPETIAIFQAFADGVNAWLDTSPLPSEYAALEVTKAGVRRWEVLDSLVIAKLMTHWLSFDGSDLANTQRLAAYEKAGKELGFDGTKLFFQDLYRAAPFDSSSTLPPTPNAGSQATLRGEANGSGQASRPLIKPHTVAAVNDYLESMPDILKNDKNETGYGSNWWVVAGSKTDTGFPLLAGDPHLGLASPPIFYEIHLVVKDPENKVRPMNINGISFSGIPIVLMGFNERIAWSTTSLTTDVVDYYEERVVMDAENKNPVATIYKGKQEPLVIIPEVYRVNQVKNGTPDDVVVVAPGTKPSGIYVPSVTRIVPRRNNGPLSPKITQSPGGPTAISVQHIGFSGTREIETFTQLARARNIDDFKKALQYYDSGAQNWVYMDVEGNIAYFASGEVPLREDLEAGAVDGMPPYFVRDGSGTRKNEWIKKEKLPPDQAIPYEIIPFDEMPQVINPPQGYIINANNDPDGNTLDNNPLNKMRRNGKSIYFLAFDYNSGYRAGMINSLIQGELDKSRGGDGTISFEDMKRFQNNVQLMDARVLTPYIIRAFESARAARAPSQLAAFAADPAMSEAVGRLSRWDFSTPTGIAEGYDSSDINGERKPPTPDEVANSIATSIYTIWRSQMLQNIFFATLLRAKIPRPMMAGNQTMQGLRHMLENFDAMQGKGASGLNFFDVQEVDLPPAAERDITLLKSLREALDMLAGDTFATAFANSKNQDDYRWGKLHRITIHHNLRTLSIPPAAGYMNVSIMLPGIGVDGAYETIDMAHHSPLASSPNGFMFSGGPTRRFVGTATKNGIKAVQVIPGGQSNDPNSRFFASQLGLWLTGGYHESVYTPEEIDRNKAIKEEFLPKK